MNRPTPTMAENRPTPTVAELQAWMQRRLMLPRQDRDAGDWSCGEMVTPSCRLSADDRLAVYVNAYTARLVECLRVEFPAVRHAAGHEAFDAFAAGYLLDQPSKSYTLAELGRGFSAYLQSTRPAKDSRLDEPDFADFLIDLAALERTYSEVFHAPGPEGHTGITTEQLREIGPESFATSRPQFYETVRLLSLRFPCHEYASNVRRGQDVIPPAPCDTPLVVFRRRFVVRRMSLAPAQFQLLRSLQNGANVEDALRRLTDSDVGLKPVDVQRAFAEWIAAEMICRFLP